jgi:hypothetical protein
VVLVRRLTKAEERANDLRSAKQVRESAFHEAGHAAVRFMFNRGVDIKYVTARYSFALYYRVRDVPRVVFRPRVKQWRLQTIAKSMMMNLAGCAAERRVSEPGTFMPNLFDEYSKGYQLPATSWLDYRLPCDGEWTEADQAKWDWYFGPAGTDIHNAVTTACEFYGANHKARRLLRRMVTWTDEAIAYPRLWAVVEALAEQLLLARARIMGNRARRIMEEAWGESSAKKPYLEMGAKWRRRLA